jgi:hypothetical protein
VESQPSKEKHWFSPDTKPSNSMTDIVSTNPPFPLFGWDNFHAIKGVVGLDVKPAITARHRSRS